MKNSVEVESRSESGLDGVHHGDMEGTEWLRFCSGLTTDGHG